MKILYFAWLRERLDKGEETVTPPAEITTVAQLIDWLAGRDAVAELAFANRKIIRAAVDTRIVPPETSIVGAQTVALFPPMTGG